MPFKNLPGLPGKVYIPEQDPDAPKKHNCPDCFSCQMCSDTRCQACRRSHEPRAHQYQKLSFKNKSSSGKIPFLKIENATIQAGGKAFFKNTDWELFSDQHWAIVGPTGSGKSLLIRAVQRKVPLSAGKILYFFDNDRSTAAQPRGYLESGEIIRIASDENIQNSFHQARWHSMETEASPFVSEFVNPENIEKRSTYEIKGEPIYAKASTRRRDMLINQLNARYLLNRKMVHLSNGEYRKIKIIRALMQSPKLLIIENPFAGLDAASRQSMQSILNNLLLSGHSKIILATNTVDDIPAGISHMLCVSQNKIIVQGKKESVLQNPTVQKLLAGNRADYPWYPSRLPLNPGRHKVGSEPVIEMANVAVRYHGVNVLEDITWQVHTGENWAIMGPNGAGKSTLLSLVLADNPQGYANEIRLFGKSRGSGETIWDIKRHIGWVAPELRRAYSVSFSCLQVVCSGFFDSIGLYRKPGTEQIDKSKQCMRAMGIEHLSELAFQQVSEGEQRLVLICRALVKPPRLLVLDEPCMGLDNYHRRLILNLLDDLCHQQIVQLIYVTHRMEEMPLSITHLLKLKNGRIVEKGKRSGF